MFVNFGSINNFIRVKWSVFVPVRSLVTKLVDRFKSFTLPMSAVHRMVKSIIYIFKL